MAKARWTHQNRCMSFCVKSSNIRFDNPGDDDHNWANRKNILSQFLLQDSPDLIGTQEGRRPQLKELEKLLPPHLLCEKHRQWIEERMYPSFFFNPSTVSVVSSGDIWLSQTPLVPGSISFNSQFPRLCTWLELIYKKENPLLCVNTHLDHILAETRQQQISVLIAEIKKINTKKLPLVLMGDFNEGPQGEVRKSITKQFENLYDPWSISNKQEMTSHHPFIGEQHQGERIDWILLDKSIKTLKITFNTRSVQGIYPSDHFPLTCLIDL